MANTLSRVTLRYTQNRDGFFETAETSRHGATETQALENIYSEITDMLKRGQIGSLDNIIFIKTETLI